LSFTVLQLRYTAAWLFSQSPMYRSLLNREICHRVLLRPKSGWIFTLECFAV